MGVRLRNGVEWEDAKIGLHYQQFLTNDYAK